VDPLTQHLTPAMASIYNDFSSSYASSYVSYRPVRQASSVITLTPSTLTSPANSHAIAPDATKLTEVKQFVETHRGFVKVGFDHTEDTESALKKGLIGI
jgi:hypothetical protein